MVITDLLLNGSSLVCISSGWPVDSVTWLKNGEEIDLMEANSTLQYQQSIEDPILSIYHQVLTSDDVSFFVDTCTCQLSDSVGFIVSRDLTISRTL